MLGRQGKSASSTTGKGRVAGKSERRGTTRTDVVSLWCDRGQVIDLSDRGMRIISSRRWSEGQVRTLTISDDHDSITLTARCIWCRQDSLFNHAVGLAFDSLAEAKAKMVRAIADRHETAGH